MARLRQRNFGGTLFIAGPPEDTPDGAVRRGRGLRRTLQQSARSRWGSTLLQAPIILPGSIVSSGIAIRSITKMGAHRFQHWALPHVPNESVLARDGTILMSASIGAGDLFYAMGPPNSLVANQDYLFVAGAVFSPSPVLVPLIRRALRKIDSSGAVSQWGIPAPRDNDDAPFAMALGPQPQIFLSTMNEDTAAWHLATESDAGSIFRGVGIAVQPTGLNDPNGVSLGLSCPPSSEVIMTRTPIGTFTDNGQPRHDLTNFHDGPPPDNTVNATPSQSQDFILLYVHINHPARVDAITLAFSIGDDTFNDAYSYEINIESDVGKKAVSKERGLGDLVPVKNQDAQFLESIAGQPQVLSEQETLGVTKVVSTTTTWTRLRIPKSIFSRQVQEAAVLTDGSTAQPPGWDNIQAVKLGVRTNAFGRAKVYFDQMQMIGGYGLAGDYAYAKTYYNANTGNRSNPNPGTFLPVIPPNMKVIGNVRQLNIVKLNDDDVHADTQVDPQITHIEIWRTIGNGSIFFGAFTGLQGNAIPVRRLQELFDSTPDYPGFADAPGSTGVNFVTAAASLSADILPMDNAIPPRTMIDVAGPHYGRLFWLDSQNPNNVYFTPAGRLEGTDTAQGFVTVIDTNENLQRLVRWYDTMWVIGELFIYQIIGTDVPFIIQRVSGDPPGVPAAQRRTVATAPAGIVYQASDGIRLFDGATSTLLGWESIGPIYSGENAENLTAFMGIVATYGRNEYIISDGTQTLAYNFQTTQWRDVGLGTSALFYEDDTGLLTAGITQLIAPPLTITADFLLALEQPNVVMDNGVPIPFELRPPSLSVPAAERSLVQRLLLEGTLNGQTLTPILILDNDEVVLPVWRNNTAAQAVAEFPIVRPARVVGVRIVGQLVQPIEIVGIEWDVYTPPGQEAAQP